jgi:hypothetical protein
MSVLGPDSPLFKKEPSKRGQWLAHHPYFVAQIMVVLAPTQQFFHGLGSPLDWISFILNQLFGGLIIFEMLATTKHLRGFCEFCFHQPAGGPAVAQKHIRQLRVHHRKVGAKRWVLISFLVALCVPGILLDGWWYVAYVIPVFFFFSYLDKASQVHAWLVPWCPWCKDDGRWTEPSPVPDPSMTKVSS